MMWRSFFGIDGAALIVLGLGARVWAAPAPGSPEAALAEAVAALNQDRLEDYTAAMHPDSLKKFRTAMTSMIDTADKEGKADRVLRLFGAKSVAELKKLDDRQFFVKFLRSTTGFNPGAKKALATAKVETIGHVPEGKDKAHVVYVLTIESEGKPLPNTIVNSLLKHEDKWALLLSGDMEDMAEMMKLQAAGKLVMPDRKSSRVEPVGRFVTGDETGPAYVVYRLVTPIGESHISMISVLTVHKTDPGWAVAQRGRHPELAELVKKELGIESTKTKEPAPGAPAKNSSPPKAEGAPRPRPGAGGP